MTARVTRASAVKAKAEETVEQRRLEEAQRLGKLYGALLPDVLLLRSRDNDVRKEGGRLLFNGRAIEPAELQAKAARERRLLGKPEPDRGRRVARTASGHKVGDSVSLKAKRSAAARCPCRR
ncbi:hypothetical protein [Reyranella sp.]|uniref:hypothetical protein n=1 Tax=Reyranella sp. TaxID=1929291 RepID=UPI003F715763